METRFASNMLGAEVSMEDLLQCKVRPPSSLYHQTSNISRTKSLNLNVSPIILQLSLSNPLRPGENEDVVGAAPTGDDPTSSERTTILLPTKVRLILEVWGYIEIKVPSSWQKCRHCMVVPEVVNIQKCSVTICIGCQTDNCSQFFQWRKIRKKITIFLF